MHEKMEKIVLPPISHILQGLNRFSDQTTTDMNLITRDMGSESKSSLCPSSSDKTTNDLNYVLNEDIDSESKFNHSLSLSDKTTMDVNFISEVFSSGSNEDVAHEKTVAHHKSLRKEVKRITCKICGKQFSTHYLKLHLKKHSNLRTYKCEMCCASFDIKQALQRHCEIHSDKSEKYKEIRSWACKVCDKVYGSKQAYTNHFQNIHQRIKVACKICHKVLQKGYLKRHMVVMHSFVCPYSCGICQKGFAYVSLLNTHSKMHTGDNAFRYKKCSKTRVEKHLTSPAPEESLSCHVCNKILSSAQSLKTHSLKHKGYRPYQCGECQKAYYSQPMLKYHMQIKHVKGNSFYCQVCSKTFPNEYCLKIHSLTHNKKFECGICQRKYSSSYLLRKHFQKHHLDANLQTFFCKICNKPFKNLVSHMQKHGQTATYKCNVCSETYSSVKDACSHILDKLLRCDLCFKIFATENQLKKHLLMHSRALEKKSKPKPKLKKCDDCNMEFSDNYAYNQHKESHDPNKQFCCEYCHERFYSFTKLYKHLGKHSG